MNRNSSVIGKKYREYLLPTVLTAMATQISSFVDSVMASNFVCSKAIAAISLLMPFQQLLYATTLLFGLGASVLISRSTGEGQYDKANRYFTISFISVLIFGLLWLVLLPFSDKIISLFASDSELCQLTKEYALPYIVGIPIYMLLFTSVHAIRLDARPKYASAIMIVANVVNLLFDYLFMGVWEFGVAGSSWATLIGNGVGFAMVLHHFYKGKSQFKVEIVSLFKSFKESLSLLKTIFTTGVSGAMGALFVVLRLQFFTSIISAISGAAGLVAFSLSITLSRLVSMFISGASQTMIPIVALCLGEGDYMGVRYVLARASKVLIIATSIILLYFLILPDTFIALYGISSLEEITLSRSALRICALSAPVEALTFLLMYYYMSISHKGISTAISIIYGLGVLVVGYLFSLIMGINGVWWAMLVNDVIALVVAYLMAIRVRKRSCGDLIDICLVPKRGENDISSFSLVASPTAAADASSFVQTSLEAYGVISQKSLLVALAVEEMTLRIAQANTITAAQMDIRIVEGDEIAISIRDNGISYNPLIPIGSEPSPSGLDVVNTISSFAEYSQVMGLNRLLIKISK